jgi:twitching motility protein PilT
VARLDKLIGLLLDQRADVLRLAAGRQAELQTDGTARTVTRDPLTAAQVVLLVQEIAPPELVDQVKDGASLTFQYNAPGGRVEAELSNGEGTPIALLRRPGGGTPATGNAEAKQQLEALLRELASSGASDLHLRSGQPPIFRRHGSLARAEAEPIAADRLETMLAALLPPAAREEYRDRHDVDWAHEIADVGRFRGNAGRDRFGPFAVFRAIPTRVQTAEELGLSREIQNLCQLSKGLVVVTGPTGSGKSTTLAAMIDLINRTRTDHILTIEDPIEFVHESKQCLVTQRQVGVHTAGFKAALRAALREDPDVVLVGEMRDLETVSIAIETAETGHLVFGTLHTTTAASTVDRIIDQFPADRQAQVRVMLSESLRGVIAQTLCKKKGGGRVAAREVLLSIPAVSNLIREGKTFQIPSIMQTNKRAGMVTLNDSLLELVDQGLVEPEEAYLKSVDRSGFASMLKAKRHDTSFLGDAA